MGKFYDAITEKQAALIAQSHLFFVASVHPELSGGPEGEGPVNVSPKGGVPLHVIDPSTVAYLDFPGSGDETGRHARAGGPVTVLAMATGPVDCGIVRLYGQARIHAPDADDPIVKRVVADPRRGMTKKPRAVVVVTVDQTQTSCGYGVPILTFVADRTPAERGRAFKEPKQATSP